MLLLFILLCFINTSEVSKRNDKKESLPGIQIKASVDGKAHTYCSEYEIKPYKVAKTQNKKLYEKLFKSNKRKRNKIKTKKKQNIWFVLFLGIALSYIKYRI
ncbi:hypothetical protein ENBRE01_1148 [Enteropsectra breve]|nr:hypothetical protein ENBRE01_1148 [Enteropsectra breve]